MLVRRFEEKDAEAVSELIAVTMRTTNRRDYTAEYLEDCIRRMQPEDMRQRAENSHFYVIEDARRVIACGAIAPWYGREDVSILLSVIVHPEYQGRGIGRRIMETLEADEFFLRAERTEIPASITGIPFYRHLGYDYKDGSAELDEEQLVRLEKRCIL